MDDVETVKGKLIEIVFFKGCDQGMFLDGYLGSHGQILPGPTYRAQKPIIFHPKSFL